MLKKFMFYLITFLIVLSNISYAYAEPNILCPSSILINADTGDILCQKNPQQKMYPASLTKITTAILALEMGNLTDIITVDAETPYNVIGSHIALEPGEILTLKELLYALMLPSANDAASAIAKHYGKTEEDFVRMMNEKVKSLGALNTHYMNPHGLHDTNHYTTAEDLALITQYAMKNETFRSIVKTTTYEIKTTNKKIEPRIFYNLNKLIYNTNSNQIYIDGQWISPLYEGVTGVKTGYTPEAGNCLVAYASRNNTNLISVGLNGVSLEMYTDAHNLFNYGFNNYENMTLIGKHTFVQSLPIKDGDSKEIAVITESDLNVLVMKNDTNKVDSHVVFNDFELPIEKDAVIGTMEFSLNGNALGKVNLISPISVKSTAPGKSSHSFEIPLILKIAFGIALIVACIKVYSIIRIKIIRDKRKRRRASK